MPSACRPEELTLARVRPAALRSNEDVAHRVGVAIDEVLSHRRRRLRTCRRRSSTAGRLTVRLGSGRADLRRASSRRSRPVEDEDVDGGVAVVLDQVRRRRLKTTKRAVGAQVGVGAGAVGLGPDADADSANHLVAAVGTKTSSRSLRSSGTRFEARDENATTQPSSLIEGEPPELAGAVRPRRQATDRKIVPRRSAGRRRAAGCGRADQVDGVGAEDGEACVGAQRRTLAAALTALSVAPVAQALDGGVCARREPGRKAETRTRTIAPARHPTAWRG